MLAQVIGFMENTTGATRSPVLLSSNFIYNGKFMEQFLALSMMNLPSNKLTPKTNNASNTLTITADTPLMIFMKTLKEFSAAERTVESEILLMQKFVDPD